MVRQRIFQQLVLPLVKGNIDGFALSGGQLSRLETHVAFAGEGADCKLSAIYMGRGEQHQDITTYMDHAVPNCT